ncbi:MarR family winged helix-turn-helix transcriptional regulator [Arsenicicoccus dermatophilus]|uniref:MarR family winged helix-turn-helix transcriptional regulator n=1 Tax=Arsenicicoccus dermatophilus TaxID=1076331 RepID=UPI001F4C5512|nr:MarR family transcriptional regulator [Arsenicicoccus dermatophilus]MCH8611608.1 MarR family transcriptional regulator [Arsenicicoccus dermatophilus]
MNYSDPRHEAASRLATALSGVIRAGFLVKQAVPTTSTGVDHGALPVLFTVHEQERRVSDIAGICHTDVSTTSRYVTALAQQGLVSKEPDEHDRRVSVIRITDAGREAVDVLRRGRSQLFAQILHDWELDEIESLTRSLDRLVASVDTYLQTIRTTTKGA